ncbi:MAG TPA: glycosyltransferase family 39 protein [Pyrinomonadaceae bacterium]
MNGALVFAYLGVCGVIILFGPAIAAPYPSIYYTVTMSDNARAVLMCTGLATIAGFYTYRLGEHARFLLRIFVAGLVLRMAVAGGIYLFSGQEFFGGDALHYNFLGYAQVQAWSGDGFFKWEIANYMRNNAAAWGMNYLVGSIYLIVGRNMLAVQFFNAVLGALTAVIIFQCAYHGFANLRVARTAAIAVAFYPSLVLWSAQGLKDAPIVFCLALAILATLKLGQKLSIQYILVLGVSLLVVFSLRFYVFYMICFAVAGAFSIGMQAVTATSFIRQFAVIIILGLGLTYLGVTRTASVQYEQIVTFEQLQRSRSDLASAESGFGQDVDVSTAGGAISTIPLGLVYLLFAPFPWQLASLRQSITLPEMLIWWACFPLMVLGLWFTIKHRLRQLSPILIFTCMLTLSYSVVQGNVGTAYRQRAQLLVFYFIFVAVGAVLFKEKREEKRRLEAEAKQEARSRMGPGVRPEQPQSARVVVQG